jgi:hypothetical protein
MNTLYQEILTLKIFSSLCAGCSVLVTFSLPPYLHELLASETLELGLGTLLFSGHIHSPYPITSLHLMPLKAIYIDNSQIYVSIPGSLLASRI